jgi:twitching motility protein PilT
MARQGADSVVFAPNKTVEMHVRGEVRPASARTVTSEQIAMLTSEVAGADFIEKLTNGIGVFTYQSPMGEVALTVVRNHLGVTMKVESSVAAGGGVSPASQPRGSVVVPRAAPLPASPPVTDPSLAPVRPPNPAPVPAAFSAPLTAARPATLPAPPPATVRSMPAHPRGRAAQAPVPHHIDELFNGMLDLRASDLHLKSDKVPMVRVDGSIMVMEGQPSLSADDVERLIMEIVPERQAREFHRNNDTDFAYEMSRARIRANVFRDRAGIGGCFRQIPWELMTARQLNLPQSILDFCTLEKGLVVITGPTGSGKSTTLAAMIDVVNETRDAHVITIEDPIEFVHEEKRCHINQREVGTQTRNFKTALRAALREDPDIVMVGEMRDLETVSIAIETAETGHLVFATLHTNTASSTIDRLIDQFPPDHQGQIRSMLSESLRGVVSQTLVKKRGGGRVAAMEVLVVNHAVSNLIREGKVFQIPSLIQTGRTVGMQTLNDSLVELVKAGLVDPQEAVDRAYDRKECASLLTRANIQGWRE